MWEVGVGSAGVMEVEGVAVGCGMRGGVLGGDCVSLIEEGDVIVFDFLTVGGLGRGGVCWQLRWRWGGSVLVGGEGSWWGLGVCLESWWGGCWVGVVWAGGVKGGRGVDGVGSRGVWVGPGVWLGEWLSSWGLGEWLLVVGVLVGLWVGVGGSLWLGVSVDVYMVVLGGGGVAVVFELGLLGGVLGGGVVVGWWCVVGGVYCGGGGGVVVGGGVVRGGGGLGLEGGLLWLLWCEGCVCGVVGGFAGVRLGMGCVGAWVRLLIVWLVGGSSIVGLVVGVLVVGGVGWDMIVVCVWGVWGFVVFVSCLGMEGGGGGCLDVGVLVVALLGGVMGLFRRCMGVGCVGWDVWGRGEFIGVGGLGGWVGGMWSFGGVVSVVCLGCCGQVRCGVCVDLCGGVVDVCIRGWGCGWSVWCDGVPGRRVRAGVVGGW
ncbi:hypothetical protein Tco_1328405 [Tanacetum coccineum]